MMRARNVIGATALLLAASTTPGMLAQEPVVVNAVVTTAPLYNYEDAPATPDADDPAVWVNRRNPAASLVIGTAKDAGLLVYDMDGTLVQALLAPNAPQVLEEDPATPAGLNPFPDNPCVDSASGETFGRFNNVDILYDLRLVADPSAPRADVAVVSDRGCDRVRFYRIDPADAAGPLIDITAPDVPRVFPTRFDQPSPFQPGGIPGWQANPVDDQNTVYGLTVAQGAADMVFVSQRERGLVRQLQVVQAPGGTLTYQTIRTFLFDTTFDLLDEGGLPYLWTPCREAVAEEPQSEGVVFDRTNGILYVAFETIGLYKLPLTASVPEFVEVGGAQLVEPVISFGRSYRATPDDDEFECEYDAEGDPAPDDVVVEGSNASAGRFLQADLEGLSIISSVPGVTFMLASSQGDSSFHFYKMTRQSPRHLGSFLVDGVGETDGVHFVPVALDWRFPAGFLVVQNGEAPEPPDTGDVNGYEFDGATQFKYVSFLDTLAALGKK